MAQSFDKSLWGYRCSEVDSYFDYLTGIQSKLKDKLHEHAVAIRINEQLKEELANIKTEISKYQSVEKSISDIFKQAQNKADSIIEEAEKNARKLENAALEELSAKRLILQQLRKRISEIRSDFEHLFAKYTSYAPKDAAASNYQAAGENQ